MVTKEKSTGDYRTVWLKYELTNSDKHQLFLKEHKIQKQEPEFPRGRTLFVLNLPPYTTVSSLRAAFSRHCGHVKSVKLAARVASTKKGYKTAYVVFSKESELQQAISLPKDFVIILNSNEAPGLFGIKKWSKEYNSGMILNEKEVKESIEKYMVAYDKIVTAEENEEEVDEDGFIKVSSKKKRGQFAPQRKESTIEEKKKKLQKEKKLVNFYQFQIREAKKQQLEEMRKKFELDKQKVKQLKSQRIFKPFG
ncbi:ribosomal RNA-processing protein 7 homolog A [Cotesia glomerata]|uniref:RRM domain-containing protein n=1 Tax=Cotesia glomerata TaxID=32391 RepID=A0AAV7INX4_COTGL|nr:ribosomal RNA-processing protein 7 homolog A [Cotesia glomerata]KAH0554300.1 hypothetical protein KQX54_009331 [Cotesia glomerata]